VVRIAPTHVLSQRATAEILLEVIAVSWIKHCLQELVTRALEGLLKDIHGAAFRILVSQSICRQRQGMFAWGDGEVLG